MTKKRCIAIVDDHTMFRRGLTALINLLDNYEVILDAGNGKEFIERLDAKRLPDIVLLDIHMPVMDGYLTAGWLRKNYPEIRILALSSMDAEMVIIKMIKNGAMGYLLKDAEPAELRQAFDEVISKGYYYNDVITRKIMQSLSLLADDTGPVGTIMRLSERELQFLQLACTEKNYQQIADLMFLSERTIDGYRETLFKKFKVGTRVGLVLYAIKNNLVQL
jgi:DNA-binding NarL/FixJ family response regulator